MAHRQQKAVLPLEMIYTFLKTGTRVRIWLTETSKTFIEGYLIGIDEFMNLVIDESVELTSKGTKEIGRMLLKGDCIAVITAAPRSEAAMGTSTSGSAPSAASSSHME